MLAKGQITVTNLDDGKTPFLHQAYKMKDGRFLKHYPVYEAPPVNGYKEGDLWHRTDGSQPGYFVANKSNTTLNLNDWTFYANELAYSDADKFYPKFEGTYSDYNEVASDDQTKYTWKIIKADDGIGIKSVKEYYAISTSNVTPPSLASDWSETPKTTDTTKKYLWNYEVYTYSNGDVKETTKRVIGTHGTTGATGASGISVSSVQEYYSVSNSDTVTPTTWQTTPQQMTQSNRYLWNYEVFNMSDGSKKETKKRVIGVYGDTGSDGKGIKSTAITYQLGDSGTATPTGTWLTTIPTPIKGKYLWARTVTTYTDSTTSTIYSVSYLPTDGQTGIDGKGIKSTAITYQIHINGNTAPVGTWSATIPSPVKGRYLWTRTIITYTDNTTSISYSTSYYPLDGQTGEDGNSITSITNYYLATTLATGVTTATSGWTTTVQTPTLAKKYLWNYEVIKYSKITDTITTPTIIGTFGETGATGASGQSVTSITEEYYLSTSKTSQTGGSWKTTPDTWTSGKYQWTRSKIVYTNPTKTEYTNPVIDTSWEAIDGIEVGGRNLLKNSDREVSAVGGREFVQFADLAPIFDEYGIDGVYSLSLDLKSSDISKMSVIQVYMQNGSGTKYNFVGASVSVTKEYQRFKFEGLKPRLASTTETKAYLAFYGIYDTGNFPIIRRVKIEKGNKATDWTPAPEDTQQAIDSKVTETDVEYYLSTSSTSPTGGTWTTTAPPWVDGKFMWSRTKIVYGNGTTRYAPSATGTCIAGATGNTGNGITSVTNRYLATTLGTGVTTATSGWTTTVQKTDSVKKYLWNYEEILYTNGTKIPTTPVIIGTHGEKGDNSVTGLLTNESITLPANKDGLVSSFTGATGVFDVYDGITKKTGSGVTYSLVSQSNITVTINATTGAYSVTAMPTGTTILNGYAVLRAIYNGVTIEKQLNVSKSVTGATGATGSTGAPGVSSYTWIRYSPNANGSAMTTTPASNSLYIGVATTTTNSAPTAYTAYTWALIKGSDGKGVKSTAITYQSGASGTTTPTGTWTTTIPSVTKGQYLWTRVITTYTDNSTSTSYSASYQGVDGVTNVTGLLTNESVTLPANVGGTVTSYTGATGTFDVFEGLTKKTGTGVTYSVLSKTNIEVTIATTGVYTITSMTSGLSTLNGFAILRAIYNGVTIDKQINVTKAVTGATGATGSSGKDGVAGKDGKGINSTVITYATSTGGTTAPTTGWTSTVPSLTKGQYLWTKTIWTYTDSTTETGYSVSYIAKDGNNGTDGIAGKDGVGIKSTSITYVGSTSGTVTPTSGWTTAVPTVASGSFLWTRTIWTYTDNTTETGYSVARMGSNGATGATGATGAPGASATSYWITASNNIIGKSQTGVINPTTITFKGFSKTGTANSVAYSGRFIIQTSTNGTTYTTRYTSSANQNTYTYTIPSDSLFVKCLFYMAGGTSVLLDEQTVPVVETAEGIQVGGENLISKNNTTYRHGTLTNTSSEKLTGSGKWFVDFLPNFEPNTTYTLSNSGIKNTGARGQVLNVLIYNGAIQTLVQTLPSMGSAGKSTFTTNSEVLPTDRLLVYISDGTTVADFEISKLKLEKGTVATDWTPAPEDARNYTAWANSADGKVDFTKIKPNENLYREGYESYIKSTYSYMEINPNLGDMVGKIHDKDAEADISGVYLGFTETGINANAGADWLINNGNPRANALTTGIESKKKYFSFYPNTQETLDKINNRFFVKLEKGSTPTIYTTNPQDSLTGSVPQYIGFSPLDSDKPEDYAWMVNPEWAEKKAEEDSDSVREWASSEITQTSESIMQSVQETYVHNTEMEEYRRDVNTQFEQTSTDFNFNFNEMIKSISKVEGDTQEQFQEISKYIRFVDGNIVLGSSESDSTLEISLNEMAFMQGGNKVAYFSGQSFYINKGAIVESLQVGEHVLTKMGNGHTSFQWIG